MIELNNNINMKVGVGIVSFNRPHYLRRCLGSVKTALSKVSCIDIDDVYLFQDGRFESSDDKPIVENINMFCEMFNGNNIIKNDRNGGPIWAHSNIGYKLFDKYDYIIGIEDDVVVDPKYFIYMLNMFLNYGNDVACVVGEMYSYASNDDVLYFRYIPANTTRNYMVRKDVWYSMMEHFKEYADIIDSCPDYRKRDKAAVEKWYTKYGYKMKVTSQDGARVVSYQLAGYNNTIFTVQPIAKYIGVVGIHGREEHYNASGYGKVQLNKDYKYIDLFENK